MPKNPASTATDETSGPLSWVNKRADATSGDVSMCILFFKNDEPRVVTIAATANCAFARRGRPIYSAARREAARCHGGRRACVGVQLADRFGLRFFFLYYSRRHAHTKISSYIFDALLSRHAPFQEDKKRRGWNLYLCGKNPVVRRARMFRFLAGCRRMQAYGAWSRLASVACAYCPLSWTEMRAPDEEHPRRYKI